MSKQVRLRPHTINMITSNQEPRETISDTVERLLNELMFFRKHVRIHSEREKVIK